MAENRQPDPTNLLDRAGLQLPLVGFYDAPDPAPFASLVEPARDARVCVFAFFQAWQQGQTLHLKQGRFGCRGASRWLGDQEWPSRADMVRFLADEEGLKASRELMSQWLDACQPYRPTHEHLLIGPLREGQYAHLKSVTFFVNPDQLGLLLLGAQYHSAPGDPAPTIAPFGSGCMQLVPLFQDLELPQAIVGATDIAMRRYLPSDVLAFTATRPLFERLCALDERSFLYKPFWQRLQQARGLR